MSESSQNREGFAFRPPPMPPVPPGMGPMPPNMRSGGLPPLPPGVKLPHGVPPPGMQPPSPSMPPMPPGMKPMPPNIRSGGLPPLPPGTKLPHGMPPPGMQSSAPSMPPMPPGMGPMPPNIRSGGLPPLPPGTKLPHGMPPPGMQPPASSMPPMPPGMGPMPPNMRPGGPPPTGGGVNGGGPMAIPATGRYPQLPSHLVSRPHGDADQGYPHHHHQQQSRHMMPPGFFRNTNDMYSMRSDGHRGSHPLTGDVHGYPESTMASSYSHGDYGAPTGQDGGDRRGVHTQRSRREDELREPTNTVWVGNLDMYEHTEEILRREFSEFGRVIRIAKVPDKSYCFVHFRHVGEACNAVRTLSARGSLGRARFNYGKMFEYTQDELEVPQEANNQRQPRRGRDDERHDNDDRRRRPRREEDRIEPTNVLWLGDLPSTLSTEELQENFKVFGNITNISRLDTRNMAFIHFETVESCTQALDLMRDQLIGGARVVLNYGRAQRNPTATETGLTADGIPSNEIPTNVVYLGQFASDVTEEDIENFFEPFEGFINSKFIQSSGIAFGHFETVEHARAARVALGNALLKGATVRISFGKSNHTMTMADRMRRGRHAPVGGDNTVASAPPPAPGLDGVSGALVAGPGAPPAGAVVALPSMGVMAGAPTVPPPPTCFTRERPAPDMTLDARLQSLLGTTYHNSGEAEKSLTPSVIQTICDLVDDCIDEKSLKRLDDAIFLYTPLNAAHVFGILTKRMHDYFNDDPHKKLLILYAATRVLLGAKTDYLFFTKSSLNAYLMTIFVASKGQTPSGMEIVTSIIENLRRHPFIERQKLDADYIEVFREQLDEIMQHAREDQDLSLLLTRKRRR